MTVTNTLRSLQARHAATLPAKLAKLPSRKLAAWIAANPGVVADIDHDGGFCTDSASDKAYDVLLAPWKCTDDGMHTIIEPRADQLLRILRTVVDCDCDRCKDSYPPKAPA